MSNSIRAEFDRETINSLMPYEEWLVAQLIIARDSLTEIKEEEAHLHKLVSRQGRLLTGVVDAVRGPPDELALHSHHDAVELVRKAMEVVHAARAVVGVVHFETDMFNRLRDALDAMPRAESVCEDCGGEGEAMTMKCYGGPPVEVRERCETCKGNGFTVAKKPLTDPSVPLPGWEEVSRKAERGEPLTPVEALIMRLTPADEPRARDFRRMLRAALDSVPPKRMDER